MPSLRATARMANTTVSGRHSTYLRRKPVQTIQTTSLIESGQTLFKAENYHFFREIWSVRDQSSKPYKGQVPKGPGWGDIISEADAEEYKKPL